ncbi:hypothetical protein [Flindersiella endophytica]
MGATVGARLRGLAVGCLQQPAEPNVVGAALTSGGGRCSRIACYSGNERRLGLCKDGLEEGVQLD